MFKYYTIFFTFISCSFLYSGNQTSTITPPLPGSALPFKISIQEADFSFPPGLQSFAFAVHDGKWLMLAGRTNGLHGFDDMNPPSNFPSTSQNTTVYVVDPNNKKIYSRSLYDPSSRLTQQQIDTLSVTASQFFQVNETLYVVGGYGVDSSTGGMSTKNTLSAINVPGLMKWVKKGSSKKSAASCIRQTSHPLLQVTGGDMYQANPHQPFLLAFGQNFQGFYTQESNGTYTNQVRPFHIVDNGRSLFIQPNHQPAPNPNYRRRDMNVVPIIEKKGKSYTEAYVGLSGVFTPGPDFGIWTVPIKINADGSTSMADPSDPNTFKQAFNNYSSANLGIYSKKTNDMYTVILGGLSFANSYPLSSGSNAPCNPPIPGYLCDSEVPFVNDITTVRIDSKGNFSQYLMSATYPLIIATYGQPPGSPLLFGSDAEFISAGHLSQFSNGVFSLDDLGHSPVLLGYIVGGIESTVANTGPQPGLQTRATSHIFKVILERQ